MLDVLLAAMDTDTADTDLLTQAFTLLDDAAAELGVMMEELSAQTDSLAALADRETEFQLFAESALESLETMDLAEAAAKVAELETVLEASYAALATVTSVSLLDHLR